MIKKKVISWICFSAIVCTWITGCNSNANTAKENTNATTEYSTVEDVKQTALQDGVYSVNFETDSSMFHVNEACEGKGTLTVENGTMTLHISLASKNIVNLYAGLAEDAQKDGATILQPTVDTVTYQDGTTEEVNGFDVPVPVLEESFDLALVGKKGTWYDHKVSVSNPVKVEETATETKAVSIDKQDGEYFVDVVLEGGSGKATIQSPATLLVKEKKAYARIEWSSPNYDYMKIGNEKYEPINTEGNSVFEIPICAWNEKMEVIADTVAMGTPHEIEYTLTFDLDSVKEQETLAYQSSMELDYATQFTLDYYNGGYSMITTSDNSRFLVVPKDAKVPSNLDREIVVLKQPIQNIYLVASAVMDMISSIDALDCVSLSGTKEEGWYIKEAKQAMKEGKIAYAGKYNMPDYEKILNTGCDLAIESTMILHSPDVKEKLESFDIPVLIDRSSYEEHPLGRTEWVKLYGVLLGKEKEAKQLFEQQKKAVERQNKEKNTGKTVAFFYITSNGTVNVRKSGDYVPKMIELAGGNYIFDNLGDDKASSSVNMQMEQFYAQAKDVDYLIYNSTIDNNLRSKEELLQKSHLLKDFKAWNEGNVFCATQNLYQEPMKAGTFITDIRMMLEDNENEEAFTYLFRLQ